MGGFPLQRRRHSEGMARDLVKRERQTDSVYYGSPSCCRATDGLVVIWMAL